MKAPRSFAVNSAATSPVQRSLFVALLFPAVAAFISLSACNDNVKPPAHHVDILEKAQPSPVGSSQNVLDKTFTLKKSVTYPFEVPAHAATPHLHGIFESFIKGGGPTTSDEAANIDFELLNDEQQAAALANHPNESVMSVEDSHNQAVNYDLPPSLDQPVKYYFVFRNPDGGKTSKVVRASFRVDF